MNLRNISSLLILVQAATCSATISSTVRGVVDDKPEAETQISSLLPFDKENGDTNAMLDGVTKLKRHLMTVSQSPLFDETKKIADLLANNIALVYANLQKLQDDNTNLLSLLKDTRADRDKVSKLYYGLKYQLQQEVVLKTPMYTYLGPGFPMTPLNQQFNSIVKVGGFPCETTCSKWYNDDDFFGYTFSTHDDGTQHDGGNCYCIFDYTLPDVPDSDGFSLSNSNSANTVRYGEIEQTTGHLGSVTYIKNVNYVNQY